MPKNRVYRTRYTVFLFVVYSIGHWLNEGLGLEVGDIDAERTRVHVRQARGDRDLNVPLPEPTP